MRALYEESQLPSTQWKEEVRRGKEFGLECVDSIEDKREISCFQRGELPHWSGINTFLKLPYLEDVQKFGEYDAAFVGVPFEVYQQGKALLETELGPAVLPVVGRKHRPCHAVYNGFDPWPAGSPGLASHEYSPHTTTTTT